MDSVTQSIPQGLIYTSDEAGVIKLHNAQTHKEVSNLGIVHDGHILATASSSDGKFFVTSDNLGNMKLFDAQTAMLLHDFGIVHDGAIEAITFEKSNHFFYSAGTTGKLKKWSAVKRKLKKDYGSAHGQSTILSLAVSKDVLFSGDGAGRLKLWPIDRLDNQTPTKRDFNAPSGTEFSHKNQKIMALKDMGPTHSGGIEAMSVSNNGDLLFTCDHYGFLKQWNIRNAKNGEVR